MKKIISILFLLLFFVNICIVQSQNEIWDRNPGYEVLEDGSIYIGGHRTTDEERQNIEQEWQNRNGGYAEEDPEKQGSLTQQISSQNKQSYQHMNIDQFYDLFSIGMKGRGYTMSVDNCQLLNQKIVGDYIECKVTDNVYFDLFYDENMMLTGLNITGYQKKAGTLNTEIDAAFRNAYSCFISDTSEASYQKWLINIQIGMRTEKTYSVNGVAAIWGEGLMTGNISRNGQYYYKIAFFL